MCSKCSFIGTDVEWYRYSRLYNHTFILVIISDKQKQLPVCPFCVSDLKINDKWDDNTWAKKIIDYQIYFNYFLILHSGAYVDIVTHCLIYTFEWLYLCAVHVKPELWTLWTATVIFHSTSRSHLSISFQPNFLIPKDSISAFPWKPQSTRHAKIQPRKMIKQDWKGGFKK